MGRLKRGQGANNAALVVILIAVLIILYILFLPPEDRAALLDDGTSGDYGSGGGAPAKVVLLSKTPGRLLPAGANVQEHKLPSFLVFTVTNANELKRVDTLYVKSSAFSQKASEVPFYYDERTTNDLKLSFNVAAKEGLLKITLNGKELFEGDLSEGSPPPITLPRENLKTKNMLLFEVSSPGIAFWRVNEYALESIVVSGKVTDYTGSMSEQHFAIGDLEYEQLDKALLEFLPDCPPREEGQLQIILNGRPLFTSFPDCGIKASIEVSKSFLTEGDNVLVATTSTGSFLLDAPKLTTFLKEQPQPVFYFTASQSVLEALYSGLRGVVVTLRFADSTTIKRGVIEVNGFKTYFETQDAIYQTPLDPEAVLSGSNGIRLVPISGVLDVAELRVELI